MFICPRQQIVNPGLLVAIGDSCECGCQICQRIDSLEHVYADVLTRIINNHPNSQIDDLLPWAYAAKQELKAVA